MIRLYDVTVESNTPGSSSKKIKLKFDNGRIFEAELGGSFEDIADQLGDFERRIREDEEYKLNFG